MRYRDRGLPVDLLQTAAFLILAVANVAGLIVATVRLEPPTGALDRPGEAAAYVFSAARLLTAFLLVAGGLMTLAGRTIRRPAVALAGPPVLLIAFVVFVAIAGPMLPPLAEWRISGSGSAASLVPAATALGAVVQLPGAALFLWAAALTRRLYRRGGSVGDRYLVVGLVFAAFAQLHLALYPPMYPGLVTTDDFLRIAFDVTLLFGIEAEARLAMTSLKRANAVLDRLRAAEADRAALEERARVSRELHDGLAQDLWLAKLKAGRLALLPGLASEAADLCRELDAAIDAGLTEARQAVLALRYPADPSAAFPELVTRYVEDFADQFGVLAEVECDASFPALPPRSEAELVRITQEALNNVRRHADATVITVRASAGATSLTLAIEDNGRGFDPTTLGEGFGLASMRERAELIGGRLKIESRPHDGTRVLVEVPLRPGPVAAPAPGSGRRDPRAAAPCGG
jgi:signal transduction histidine kinase